MKNINLFVYGSLRENFFNYDKYLQDFRKIRDELLEIEPYKLSPSRG